MLRKPFVLVLIRLRVRARHHEEAAMKMIHETHEKHKKNQCNLCNLWVSFFHRLRARQAVS
jgi:hypothetical protein